MASWSIAILFIVQDHGSDHFILEFDGCICATALSEKILRIGLLRTHFNTTTHCLVWWSSDDQSGGTVTNVLMAVYLHCLAPLCSQVVERMFGSEALLTLQPFGRFRGSSPCDTFH